MSRLFLLVLVCVVVGFTVAADEPKTPQWQRVLTGDDAKTAAAVRQKFEGLAAKDDLAGAIEAAEELLALRTKLQGGDHHQTVTVKHEIAAFRKIAKLSAEKRQGWRTALAGMKEVPQLEAKGRYAEALPKRQTLLKWCQEVLGEEHPHTAVSYTNVAFNLNAQSKCAEAQPLYEKALAIFRNALGEEHPETATGYNNLGFNLNAQSKHAEAQSLYQKALDIRRNVLGENHPATGLCYNNLAHSLHSQGKHAEAQPLFEQALGIFRKALGEEHQHTATGYNSLGFNLNAQGKYAEAQRFYEKALAVRRKVLGEEHLHTAISYNNLALNLGAQAKHAEARSLHQKVLDIRREALGEEHPDTARSYNNLAGNLTEQGKHAEAQPLHQKALDVRRKVLGEEHPETAQSYNNVAQNLDDQGKHAEAQPLYQTALAVRRKVLGEDHRDTAASYNNLAGNVQNQGKGVEARALFEKALAVRRKALGEEHPDTAQSCNNLADNLGIQEKYAEAQPLYEKALAIFRKALGEEHPDTASGYNNLASNLKAQGKYAEAQPLYEKALAIFRKALGEEHPRTAISYSNLARSLAAQGKYDEAQPLYQKTLDIFRRVFGEEHLRTAEGFNSVASNLAAQGKRTEAESVLQQAVHSYESARLAGASGLDRASLKGFNPRLQLAVWRQSEQPAEAWRLVELSLARGLLDQQATRHDPALTNDERAEQVKQRERIATLQPQILILSTKAKRTEAETANLESLLAERRGAEKRLAAIAVALSQREVADPETIRKALPVDAALLFWVDVSARSAGLHEHWLCVVRPTGDPRWERLPGTGLEMKWAETDTELPWRLRAALARSASHAQVEAFATRLHTQRIAPALKHLDGVKTLYIIPTGYMAGVPVELLTADRTVSYVPSGTFLVRAKGKALPAGQQLLVLGDPVFARPDDKRAIPKPLPTGGLLITQVIPDGVAAKGRLQAGDVLIRYGDANLTDADSLNIAIVANERAASVPVTVWRETADRPFVRDVAPGRLGVVLARDSAPIALANRRKTDTLLASLRGDDWKDLPGTRVETDRLRQMLGDQCVALTDSAASEQSLEALRKLGELSKFRYLHFATHGAGNEVRAFESALILAQDKLPKDAMPKVGEPYINGQLAAAEVLEFWKLDAELVTLSACETATGKPTSGDGSLGFAQAFLHAGARSVCLSLWKVDDTATALFMDRFYQNLLGKRAGLAKPMGKAAALDEAKRWLRNLSGEEALALTAKFTKGAARGPRAKDEELKLVVPSGDPKVPPAKDTKPFAHPKYWAAFVLIGDPN